MRKARRVIAYAGLGLVVMLSTTVRAKKTSKCRIENMAPLDQYLMEPSAEIALARSAAPESIALDDGVMILDDPPK